MQVFHLKSIKSTEMHLYYSLVLFQFFLLPGNVIFLHYLALCLLLQTSLLPLQYLLELFLSFGN